jgi:multidrug resistance efflux pump
MESKYQIPLKSFSHVYRYSKISKVKYWFIGIMLFLVLAAFLPWTQNIKARGTITSLYQDQRPQEINSPIPGKIVKWWVKEGDFVKKGDTPFKDFRDKGRLPRSGLGIQNSAAS